jgi:hypothetical protein
MNPIIKRLRCSTEMEEGFVMDAMMGGAMVARWVAGPPDSSWGGGVKIKGKEMRSLRRIVVRSVDIWNRMRTRLSSEMKKAEDITIRQCPWTQN